MYRQSVDYKCASKRASFTLQKSTFYTSKEHLLPRKRASFTLQKSVFLFVDGKRIYIRG